MGDWMAYAYPREEDKRSTCMSYDGVLLTFEQAEKIARVLIWAGKQEDSSITLEEAKELAKHLYYRTDTKPKEE